MVNLFKRFYVLVFLLIAAQFSASAQSSFGAYQSAGHLQNGVLIQTEKGLLQITFYADQMVRVDWQGKHDKAWPDPAAVYHKALNKTVRIEENRKQIVISDKDISVHINKKNLSIELYYEGNKLSEMAGILNHQNLQGFRFTLDHNEHLYGTGERALALDRRGKRLELNNQPHYAYAYGEANLNYSVPLVMSSRNYLIYFDNPARGFVDLGKSDPDVLTFEAMGGPWRFFWIAADNPGGLMKKYSWLTGRQDLPPRWAFGNLLSRFGYQNEKQVRDIVQKMQDNDFPLDALIIDLYWFGKGVKDSFYMGNLSWDTSAWPHPEKLISDLKQKGIQTILITEPFILQESKNYSICDQEKLMALDSSGNTYVIPNFWFGLTGLLDIFKPGTQDWFWKKYKKQIAIGVAAWWGDLGEPEKHPGDMIHVNGTADEVHNIYGHYWDKMLYDRYEKEYPGTRLFNLNRSGFAGSQRFSVFPWSGDVSRSWSGLQAQLPIMLGMSQSGVPYMHSDLGGFAMGKKDEELYIRWMQFGTFTPIFRPHGSGIPSEPVYFNDSTQKIVRKYMKLRYRMLPYNYSMAWRNTQSGLPLAAPLSFYNPDNEKCALIENEYYWGKEMLIAPVLTKDISSRSIYLPGGQWVDFNTDQIYAGDQTIAYPLKIDEIPVFVQSGSFIPMTEAIRTTRDYNPALLYLHYYPSNTDTADFTLYEDDGITNKSWQNGANEQLHFMGFKQLDGSTEIRLNRKSKGYPGMPAIREMTLIVHTLKKMPEKLEINGQDIALYAGDAPDVFPVAHWDTNKQLLYISWLWDHAPVRIFFH